VANLADNIDLGDFKAGVGPLFDGILSLGWCSKNGNDGVV
jgi:hypothetical protein